MNINVGFLKAVRNIFGAVGATASAIERVATTADNFAQLGENYSGYMVKEQSEIQKQRLDDLTDKANKKYAKEKKEWNI